MYLLLAILFALFSIYTLSMVFIEAESCGCFGQFNVSPIKAFMIDIGAFALMLLTWLIIPSQVKSSSPIIVPRHSLAVVVKIALLVTCLFTPVIVAATVIARRSNTIYLDVLAWRNIKLPIVNMIELDTNLSAGNHMLIFYRHSCEHCRLAISEFLRYDYLDKANVNTQLSLIQLPPYGTDCILPLEMAMLTKCQFGNLDSRCEWIGEVPLFVNLSNGVVVDSGRVGRVGPSSVQNAEMPSSNKLGQDRDTMMFKSGIGEVRFGMKKDEIVSKWGQPDEISSKGRSLNYWSKGVTLSVSTSRGLDMINCLSSLSSNKSMDCQAKTKNGVGIHSTEQDLEIHFGKPSRRNVNGETTELYYSALSAYFFVFNGKIVQITLQYPDAKR